MCSFLLRPVGGEVGGWAVREAEPAHTDYTGKRNNVSSSNWQYLAHKKKSISPKSISPCLSTFLPSCERYGAVCILVRWFSPTEKLHCFISCWYLPTNGGGNLQGTNRSLGIRPPRHYILSLIKHRGFSVCMFAQVVCVCVCVRDMSSHAKAAGKRFVFCLIKQCRANIARTLLESACFY